MRGCPYVRNLCFDSSRIARCNPRPYSYPNVNRPGGLVNSKRIPLASTLLAVTSAALALLAAPAAAEATSIWQVQTTANPQAMALTDTVFSSVSASGPDEAWGVGAHSNRQASDHPLVEHWNGTSWTKISVPNPVGQQATLSGVDDLSPSNAGAVGQSGPSGRVHERTLIEHW